MCGVIGIRYKNENPDIGQIATKLLKTLEYRGYDSTGAVVQDINNKITMLKDVGAPSKVAPQIGIDKLSGNIFCGQVRWATFGVVNKVNCQPHEVKCKTHLYGAHNGNITNCHQQKEWLIKRGHHVESENDGEIVVHTIEHFFHAELEYKKSNDQSVRKEALIQAVLKSQEYFTGSFAAIIVDPISKYMVAIKSGSSLYLGQGFHKDGGEFHMASSDIASVLQETRILIPIKEKEFAIFDSNSIEIRALDGKIIKHKPMRSLLKLEETQLSSEYNFFMDQEINNQIQTSQKLINLFTGGSEITKFLNRNNNKHSATIRSVNKSIIELTKITDPTKLLKKSTQFYNSDQLNTLKNIISKYKGDKENLSLQSSYASFIEELKNSFDQEIDLPLLLKFLDSIVELDDIKDIEGRLLKFFKIIKNAQSKGKTIFMLACGTSHHAAKTAPLFFNEIAGIQVFPLLPGEFRAQCTNSLRDGDVVIGISQSGETKDLIDVFNFVRQTKKKISIISLLNNTNSTMAIEKSDLYIPLFCGPEIAVPATKSFLNQLLVLYVLAIRTSEYLDGHKRETKIAIKKHLENLKQVPSLIEKTLKTTQKETDDFADQLHLTPSMHILATRILGIAKEGALKIREVVLNHTEGFEGSEFKHGPNTILGVNTTFGFDSINAMLNKMSEVAMFRVADSNDPSIDKGSAYRLFKSLIDFAFKDIQPTLLTSVEREMFSKITKETDFFESLYSNYPLIFITCPEEQDINLTISQINTHKIRGANVFMIAEDNDKLRQAVSQSPSSQYPYKYGIITLPKTGNSILSIFSISVVLQVLAFKMSIKKMDLMNRLEIEGHGVHPDAPKNVSKSITVD